MIINKLKKLSESKRSMGDCGCIIVEEEHRIERIRPKLPSTVGVLIEHKRKQCVSCILDTTIGGLV